MKPNEQNDRQSGVSLSTEQPVLTTNQDRTYLQSQDAASQVIRGQIDNIYDSQPTVTNQTAELKADNPYYRTHTDRPSPQSAEWRKYHTAWQEYYQKYYESYYKHHVEIIKRQHAISNDASQAKQEKRAIFGFNTEHEEQPITSEEAVFNLRQRLLAGVRQSSTRARKSRHFVPILSGIIAVLILLFMQYNRILISNVMAYVSPGNIDPQNIIIDPNVELTVGPQSKLIIPKINVDAPVIYDVGNDYNSQMAAMEKGIAHFAIPGANSHPGEIGNTVLSGHSSNDLFDGGDYKFIFAQLDKLNVGDTIYANYKSKRYTYTITKKEVVAPNDVHKLVYTTKKPIMTLITCTPLGTSLNRLLVTAEQISPDPDKATKVANTNQTETTSIPGTTPSFFEKLFGINN